MTYVKVDQSLTDSRAFRALSWNGGALFFRLLSHKLMKSFGLLRATPGGLEDELGGHLSKSEIIACLDELQAAGMIRWETGCISVSLDLFDNPNPNLLNSWERHLDDQLPCDVYDARLEELAARLSERIAKAPEKSRALWLKSLPEQLRAIMDVEALATGREPSEAPPEDEAPKPAPTANLTASQTPSRTPSQTTLSLSHSSQLLTHNSYLKRKAADARDGPVPPAEPANDHPPPATQIAAVAFGREALGGKDGERLARLIEEHGAERVTQHAEWVMARYIAEGREAPTSVGLVAKVLREGGPDAETLGEPADHDFAAFLRFKVSERIQGHPFGDRLARLAPLLQTQAGLAGLALGLGRYDTAEHERKAGAA